MLGPRALRGAALIFLVVVLVNADSSPLLAQRVDELGKLNAEVVQLSRAGKNAEAALVAKLALTVAEKQFGPDHRLVGKAANNLAIVYERVGQEVAAEELYKRCIAIYERVLGPDHLDLGTILTNLAELYRGHDRQGEAEPLYRRSLAIVEQALGPDDPEVAALLNSLGELVRTQEQFVETEALHRRALKIREMAFGPDHADVGTSLNNLGLSLAGLQRYAEAEPLYRRALAISEKLSSADGAITMINLALLTLPDFSMRTVIAPPDGRCRRKPNPIPGDRAARVESFAGVTLSQRRRSVHPVDRGAGANPDVIVSGADAARSPGTKRFGRKPSYPPVWHISTTRLLP